jgi:uncharacterized protein YjdB
MKKLLLRSKTTFCLILFGITAITTSSGFVPKYTVSKNSGFSGDNPDFLLENILKFSSEAEFFACTQPYQDINGLVVMEAENLSVPSGWAKQSSFSGYTGSGYINWTGSEYFSSVGNGLISTKIFINSPGVYRFQMRSRVGNGTSSTEHNDTWVRFPDASDYFALKGSGTTKIYPKGSGKTPNPNGAGSAGWFKIYMNSLNWTWSTLTSDNDPHDIYVQFNSSGVYTMELSARSAFHLIDRIVLHKNASNPLSLTNPETKCSDQVTNIPVTSVALNPTTASIQTGSTSQLSATVSPTNATNKTVTWSSSNSNVASVNSNGLVSGVAVGTAIITARTQDGNFSATSSITVTQNSSSISIAGFVLINAGNDTEIQTLTNGTQLLSSQVGSLSLNVKVNTNPTTVGSVFISLSGPVNATRTENGAPYALFGDTNGNYTGRTLPNGNYTLSAIPYSGSNRSGTEGATTTIQFSIVSSTSIAVTGIEVSPSSASIEIGGNQQLIATVLPSNASNKSIIWSSSNSNIASVNSSGLVTALSAGSATITASTQDGNFTASSGITVTQSVPNLGITSFVLINAGNNSEIQTLSNGSLLLSNQVGSLSLNIKVNTNPNTVGSVFISLTGPVNATRTESVAPYALFGDNNGNYSGRILPNGNYTLSAIAYSGANRSGTAGPLTTISFQISNTNSRMIGGNDPELIMDSSNSVLANGKENKMSSSEKNLDFKTESLKVYPNPVKENKLYISDPLWNDETINYSIYSGTGKMLVNGSVKIGPLKSIEVNLDKNKFPSGVYYMVLEGDYYFTPKRVSIIIQ